MSEQTQVKAPRPRRVTGTALKSYLWERVPRKLLEDATTKCKQQEPPLSLKWLLIQLLKEWTYGKATP